MVLISDTTAEEMNEHLRGNRESQLRTFCPCRNKPREFVYVGKEESGDITDGLRNVSRYECSMCGQEYNGFYLMMWRSQFENGK